MNFKKILAKNYINFRGWRTKRKFIIFESDDWGSVRIASKDVVDQIVQSSSQYANSNFVKFDGLETTEDLEMLFEVLSKFKDCKGTHPVITALVLTSNPDFKKISKTNYEYHTELITETYKRYGEYKLFDLWKDCGIGGNLLYPQFHGKEHIHPERYISRIQDVLDVEHIGFLNQSIIGGNIENSRTKNFMASFEYHNEQDKIIIERRAAQGLVEFDELFGFKSKSFCPSQSIYGDHLFEVLKIYGVKAIQAGQQFLPGNLSLKKIDHYWGDTTYNGLVFWRRNCTFEPYKGASIDHVNECLRDIEIAFRWGKPAVINSHRINFTSRISTVNRDRTLSDLNILLKKIINKWPDVEFINSSDLVDHICH